MLNNLRNFTFKNKNTAAAALAVAVLFLIVILALYRETLPASIEIYNTETGKVYRAFNAPEGTEFSVSFIHSVNKSPVTDYFVIHDEKIVAEKTVYSAFGAGVQSTLEEGQTLSYDDDGNMVVSGFNSVFPEVKYIVGTVYDHVLTIHGREYSLTKMCGQNAHIAIVLKKPKWRLNEDDENN